MFILIKFEPSEFEPVDFSAFSFFVGVVLVSSIESEEESPETSISFLNFSKVFFPIPLTFISSSIDLKGPFFVL